MAIQSIAAGSARYPVGSVVPDPVELVAEAGPSAELGVRAVRHDERVDPVAAIGPDPQHARSLRAAQPLVAVAGPVGGSEAVEIDRHHAGRVRAVDQRVDPAAIELGDQLGDGQDQGRRAGDVADQDEPCPLRDLGEDRVERLAWVGDRERDPRDDDPCAIAGGDRAQAR